MAKRRTHKREPLTVEIRYYAGGRLGFDNWSRKSYALTINNARQRAVMKLAIDWWQKVVLIDRYTGTVICRFVRTSYGIHEV